MWNHARIRSWNQPVLSNKGNFSRPPKLRQTCNQLRHAAPYVFTHIHIRFLILSKKRFLCEQYPYKSNILYTVWCIDLLWHYRNWDAWHSSLSGRYIGLPPDIDLSNLLLIFLLYLTWPWFWFGIVWSHQTKNSPFKFWLFSFMSSYVIYTWIRSLKK